MNEDVWRSSRVLDIFARREGWIDRGEAALFERALQENGRRPILDVGVGGGRTIPILQPETEQYVAVDYLDEMVALAASSHPGARVERADARNLAQFSDGAFGAVFFSFNGIDGVPHEDRARVYGAVMRVLAPGGVFAYSTHNLDHCCAGCPPWDRGWLDLENGPRAAAVALIRLPRRARNYRRLRGRATRGDGWGLLVGSGYDFTVLWHHVTLERERTALLQAGFEANVGIYDDSGSPLSAGEGSGGVPWLYVIARKPGRGRPG